MAAVKLVVIEISSSSEDDDDDDDDSSKKLVKLITHYCVNLKGRGNGKEEGDDDDCVILETNPFDNDDCVILETDPFEEEETTTTITNLSKMLTLGSEPLRLLHEPSTTQHHVQLQDPDEDLSIIKERGKVACRDYPHSRHLCAQYPFDKTPHENYCSQCYCYVCDKAAPCQSWKGTLEGHCHASEMESKWKAMRKTNRPIPATGPISS